jgi:DNA-damage-inducible protein J
MAKEHALPGDYDSWFRARVQEAMDDPRPGISQEVVRDEMRAIIDQIAARKAAGRVDIGD